MAINILTFSDFYLPGYKAGGPIKTIKNLIANTDDKFDFRIVTRDRDSGDKKAYACVKPGHWNSTKNTPVYYCEPGIKTYAQILSILAKKNYDLVYLNSFFSPSFSLFPLIISLILGKKVVLGPRGEFSEGALSIKGLKKRIFLTLAKRLKLYDKVIFQASSRHEEEDIHRIMSSKVETFIAEDIGSQEYPQYIPPPSPDAYKAVFISRISPKKNLLGALKMLENIDGMVTYDIYGPIEDIAYWNKCVTQIQTLPENISVNYRGEIQPELVIQTLKEYDLFFFPTLGENYGHVIAEAFCAGLPVLISDTTPWLDLQSKGIGWSLSLSSPNDFVSVIQSQLSATVNERIDLRHRVLEWAKTKFSSRDAIDANIAMFLHAAKALKNN